MNEDHIELLADMQRLVIAGYQQTGFTLVHSVTARNGPEGMNLDSAVIVLPSIGEAWSISATTSSYSIDGYTTLTEQRDRLARWIAKNRREELA